MDVGIENTECPQSDIFQKIHIERKQKEEKKEKHAKRRQNNLILVSIKMTNFFFITLKCIFNQRSKNYFKNDSAAHHESPLAVKKKESVDVDHHWKSKKINPENFR
jgi:hypothetical protein